MVGKWWYGIGILGVSFLGDKKLISIRAKVLAIRGTFLGYITGNEKTRVRYT